MSGAAGSGVNCLSRKGRWGETTSTRVTLVTRTQHDTGRALDSHLNIRRNSFTPSNTIEHEHISEQSIAIRRRHQCVTAHRINAIIVSASIRSR